MTRRSVLVQLVAASFIVLFQELAFIRWLPEQVRVVAYFPNVVLIAAFLGLGVGCLLTTRRSLLPLWPVTVLVLAAVAVWMHRFVFTSESPTEHLWLLYYDLPANAPRVQSVRLPILVMFVLSAMTFVPLGQFVSSRLELAKRLATSLWGYLADLCGSLAGIVAFAILSFALVPPIVWFIVIFAAGVVLMLDRRRHLALHAVAAVAIVTIVAMAHRATVYSPYYALTAKGGADGALLVMTNGSLHQVAEPLGTLGVRDVYGETRTGYHLPYRQMNRKPKRVLILGAGTGNDVAVALSEGVEHVDAVEIDPLILRLGKLHPNHPYDDPRVHAINTDARAFLSHTSDRYDLVIFGTLDSMTRLSALSTVRLDNYVYTEQCLQAVRRHLNADGGVMMFFFVSKAFIAQHIEATILAGLRMWPHVIKHDYQLFNHMYLAGPLFERPGEPPPPITDQLVSDVRASTAIPNDDWPYLYLERPGLSWFYVSLILAMLLIAAGAVFGASREMRGARFDAEMFFFGVAFLLIETRLVTEMNLIWSATWVTSAVVFGSILLTIIAATLLTQLRPLPWRIAAPLLLAALAATWLVPARGFVGLDPLPRLAVSALFIGAPVFFASCCFALLFAEREQPAIAFGWNMLGAVAGGLLEFTSMAIGIKAMALLAAVAYLIAILVRTRRTPAASV